MDTFDIATLADFRLRVVELGDKAKRYRFLGAPDALSEASERLNIQAVYALSAVIEVKRDGHATGFHVSGEMTASVDQGCVVTLAPVRQEMTSSFHRHFVPLDRFEELNKTEDDIVVDLDATDDLELLEGDTLDFTAVLLEEVALGLDPYPRAEGVAFDDIVDGKDEPKENPFAVLAQLKSPVK